MRLAALAQIARGAALCLAFVAAPMVAWAEELEFSGLADLRVASDPNETSWVHGGLDKFRYDGKGGAQGNIGAGLHEAAGVADWNVPDWSAHLVARYAPDQRTPLDVTEGFVRYRPASSTPLLWSVKAGAFFPPISLENTGIAWTTPWTLTPSVIDSWVGEELRTIGAEPSLAWRGEGYTLTASAALYTANDPAGVLLADRGWSFNDLGTGLFDANRMPNVSAATARRQIPFTESPYQEIDGRPGWYGAVDYQAPGVGELRLMRYDNEADPAVHGTDFAWRTDFWAAGGQTQLGPVVVLAQAMAGETVIQPTAAIFNNTHFQAGYLLIGYELGEWHGAWRVAGRADLFATQNRGANPETSEHGKSGTLALTWRPADWCRVTGEYLRTDSWRAQRVAAGLSPRERDGQAQLALKLFY